MPDFEQLTKKPPPSSQNLPQDDNTKNKLLIIPLLAQLYKFLITLKLTIKDVEEIEEENKNKDNNKEKS